MPRSPSIVLVLGLLAAACEQEGAGRVDAGEDDPVVEADDGPAGAYVTILSSADGFSVPNPVTFTFEAGGSVVTVTFEADGWALSDEPLAADLGSFTYRFSLIDVERTVLLKGFDAMGDPVAVDEVRLTPYEEHCRIPDQIGFNRYTVRAIND